MDVMSLDPTSASSLLRAFGLIGFFAILFVETGLLVGFFLPGDGLLFLAGVVAAGASAEVAGLDLPLPALLAGAPISAIAGSQLGYLIGRAAGRRLARGRHRERLDRGQRYLERYGVAKALVLARFVGVLRTVVNPAAGMLRVPPRKFLLWNVLGGVLWTDGLILAGYLFGASAPFDVDAVLTPLILTIMAVATAPAVLGYLRRPRVRPPTIDQDGRSADLFDAMTNDRGPVLPLMTKAEAAAHAHILDQVLRSYPECPTRALAGDLAGRLHDRIEVVR